MPPIQKIPTGTYKIGPGFAHELDHPGIIRTTLRDDVGTEVAERAAKDFFALLAGDDSARTAHPWLWLLDLEPVADLGWAAIDAMKKWLSAFKDQGRRGDVPPTLVAIAPKPSDRLFLGQAAQPTGLSPQIHAGRHPATSVFRALSHEFRPKF